MELYQESKPMEKRYAERLYQSWNAKMPDHKTTKVALTTRISRIRRGEGLLRLKLVEPDSGGLATLTETVEEGVGAQGQGELHQVQAVTVQMVSCLQPLLKLLQMIILVPGQVAMIN